MYIKPARSLGLRIIATALCVAFATGDIAFAAPVSGGPAAVAPAARMAATSLHYSSDHLLLREFHEGANGKLLIHVQDAHANPGAQIHLAAALKEFIDKDSVRLVLVEGAGGDVTLAGYRAAASPEVWATVALRFLKEGKIAGEEYLNLTTDLPMRLEGIEDRGLYDAALAGYAELAGRREEALAFTRRIRMAIDRLKNRHYPPALLALENKKSAFESGSEQSWQSLRAAALAAGIAPGSARPEIAKLEADPDLSAANVDVARLMNESESLEREVYDALLTDSGSRRIHACDRYARLLEEAYSIAISSDGFAELRAGREIFDTESMLAFLNGRLVRDGAGDAVVAYDPVLEDAAPALDRFYDLVGARDEAFMRNTDRLLEREDRAVLIAGGYHTARLTRLWKEKGYSYAVFAPRVEEWTDKTDYEKGLFANSSKIRALALGDVNAGGKPNVHLAELLDAVALAQGSRDPVGPAVLRAADARPAPGPRASGSRIAEKWRSFTMYSRMTIFALAGWGRGSFEYRAPKFSPYNDEIAHGILDFSERWTGRKFAIAQHKDDPMRYQIIRHPRNQAGLPACSADYELLGFLPPNIYGEPRWKLYRQMDSMFRRHPRVMMRNSVPSDRRPDEPAYLSPAQLIEEFGPVDGPFKEKQYEQAQTVIEAALRQVDRIAVENHELFPDGTRDIGEKLKIVGLYPETRLLIPTNTPTYRWGTLRNSRTRRPLVMISVPYFAQLDVTNPEDVRWAAYILLYGWEWHLRDVEASKNLSRANAIESLRRFDAAVEKGDPRFRTRRVRAMHARLLRGDTERLRVLRGILRSDIRLFEDDLQPMIDRLRDLYPYDPNAVLSTELRGTAVAAALKDLQLQESLRRQIYVFESKADELTQRAIAIGDFDAALLLNRTANTLLGEYARVDLGLLPMSRYVNWLRMLLRGGKYSEFLKALHDLRRGVLPVSTGRKLKIFQEEKMILLGTAASARFEQRMEEIFDLHEAFMEQPANVRRVREIRNEAFRLWSQIKKSYGEETAGSRAAGPEPDVRPGATKTIRVGPGRIEVVYEPSSQIDPVSARADVIVMPFNDKGLHEIKRIQWKGEFSDDYTYHNAQRNVVGKASIIHNPASRLRGTYPKAVVHAVNRHVESKNFKPTQGFDDPRVAPVNLERAVWSALGASFATYSSVLIPDILTGRATADDADRLVRTAVRYMTGMRWRVLPSSSIWPDLHKDSEPSVRILIHDPAVFNRVSARLDGYLETTGFDPMAPFQDAATLWEALRKMRELAAGRNVSLDFSEFLLRLGELGEKASAMGDNWVWISAREIQKRYVSDFSAPELDFGREFVSALGKDVKDREISQTQRDSLLPFHRNFIGVAAGHELALVSAQYGTGNVKVRVVLETERVPVYKFHVFPHLDPAEFSEVDKILKSSRENYPGVRPGSIGRVIARLLLVDGEPALVFNENQTTEAFQRLPKPLIKRYEKIWIEAAQTHAVALAAKAGIRRVYAYSAETVKRTGGYYEGRITQEHRMYDKPYEGWGATRLGLVAVYGEPQVMELYRFPGDVESVTPLESLSEFGPQFLGFSDIRPPVHGDAQSLSARREIEATAAFDKAVSPEKVRFAVHYGDPNLQIRWRDLEKFEIISAEGGSYTARFKLPRDVRTYTLKVSADGGKSWAWLGSNITVLPAGARAVVSLPRLVEALPEESELLEWAGRVIGSGVESRTKIPLAIDARRAVYAERSADTVSFSALTGGPFVATVGADAVEEFRREASGRARARATGPGRDVVSVEAEIQKIRERLTAEKTRVSTEAPFVVIRLNAASLGPVDDSGALLDYVSMARGIDERWRRLGMRAALRIDFTPVARRQIKASSNPDWARLLADSDSAGAAIEKDMELERAARRPVLLLDVRPKELLTPGRFNRLQKAGRAALATDPVESAGPGETGYIDLIGLTQDLVLSARQASAGRLTNTRILNRLNASPEDALRILTARASLRLVLRNPLSWTLRIDLDTLAELARMARRELETSK